MTDAEADTPAQERTSRVSLIRRIKQILRRLFSEETPVEGPEVHHPHARHGGLPRWLELSIAVTALVTSISSIVIAVHHGEIMEKLVQANSLPYMQGGFSAVTPEGAPVLSLDLLNRGVGPAHERSLRVTVAGRYVTSLEELIAASLEPAQVAQVEQAQKDQILNIATNSVRHRFIPGGEEQPVFRVLRTPENERYWQLLQAARPKWDVEFCYCSVFDECWQVLGILGEPEPVKECVRDESREFMP
jgi:hypothetical protein